MGLFSSKSGQAAVVLPEPPVAPSTPTPAPPPAAAPAAPRPVPALLRNSAAQTSLNAERRTAFDQLKVRIHQQLVQRLDAQKLKTLPPDTVRAEVRVVIRELCQNERGLLSSTDQE